MRIALKPLWPRPRVTAGHLLWGWCPKGMPPAEWKSIRRPLWPILVTFMAMLTPCVIVLLYEAASAGLISKSVLPPRRNMAYVGLAPIAGCVFMVAIPTKRQRRFHEALRLLQYEACLQCGYDLRGLPNVHQCPECGTEYEKAEVRMVWKAWFDQKD